MFMASRTMVPVAEHFNSSCDPDCDYVDAAVFQRNSGEQEHIELQRKLILYSGNVREQCGFAIFPNQRLNLLPAECRIAACVVPGPRPPNSLFVEPPFLLIEITSADDPYRAMQEKLADYESFGVNYANRSAA